MLNWVLIVRFVLIVLALMILVLLAIKRPENPRPLTITAGALVLLSLALGSFGGLTSR